ncbi:MAG: hypothetical protein ACRD1G_14430, partial [Acidimicrobiales bacterium]
MVVMRPRRELREFGGEVGPPGQGRGRPVDRAVRGPRFEVAGMGHFVAGHRQTDCRHVRVPQHRPQNGRLKAVVLDADAADAVAEIVLLVGRLELGGELFDRVVAPAHAEQVEVLLLVGADGDTGREVRRALLGDRRVPCLDDREPFGQPLPHGPG